MSMKTTVSTRLGKNKGTEKLLLIGMKLKPKF